MSTHDRESSACRDPELRRLLAGYELGLLEPSDAARVVAHAYTCDECFEELYAMAPVVASLRRTAAGSPSVGGSAELTRDPASPRERLPRRGRLAWWAAAAAVLIIAVVVVRAPRAPDELRGGSGASEELLIFGPVHVVTGLPEFDWSHSPLAVSYELRLSAADGSGAWTWTAETPPSPPPADALPILRRGGDFEWQVVAETANGERWGRATARFRVTPR